MSPNIPQMLEAHFGVMLAGGVLVSINMRLSTGEIEYILNHSGTRFLFFDTELGENIQGIYTDLETVEQTNNIIDVDVFEALPGSDYEYFLTLRSSDFFRGPIAHFKAPCSVDLYEIYYQALQNP